MVDKTAKPFGQYPRCKLKMLRVADGGSEKGLPYLEVCIMSSKRFDIDT